MIKNKKETIPVYPFKLEIVEKKDVEGSFKFEIIHKNQIMFYKKISLTDTLKFNNESAKQKIIKKIRARQNNLIHIGSILEIDNKVYEVINIFNFINENGFDEEDISLGEVK